MTTVEILKAMSEDSTLIGEVLDYLDYGMRTEWDCGLFQSMSDDYGFGLPELRIAAVTGFQAAEHNEMQKTMQWWPEHTGNKWCIIGNNDAADMLTLEVGTPLFRTKREAQEWIDKSLKSHLPKE